MLFLCESFGMAMALSFAISELVKDLEFGQLKTEQSAAISKFASGKDVFVALPTGYGKSLCYCCLPYVFDRLKSVEKQSIVVVVSPLVALMKDQVAGCSSMGLNTGYVNAEPGNRHAARGIGREVSTRVHEPRIVVHCAKLARNVEGRALLL